MNKIRREEAVFVAKLKLYKYNSNLVKLFEEYIKTKERPLFEDDRFRELIKVCKKLNIDVKELKNG